LLSSLDVVAVSKAPSPESNPYSPLPVITVIERHGPFSNLAELKTHPAHLAVFINYLLSNASPNSLFFYVITDAFQNAQGAPKDFRRWAFEIFTTFVIPNSPLVIPNSDQSIIQPIDKVNTIDLLGRFFSSWIFVYFLK
uniref:RGS-like domain-containing protein n=1 Tax=Angiostrongylus costaricensis TaxID=334426 RepID=A0A0R3PPB6_ANGCS